MNLYLSKLAQDISAGGKYDPRPILVIGALVLAGFICGVICTVAVQWAWEWVDRI